MPRPSRRPVRVLAIRPRHRPTTLPGCGRRSENPRRLMEGRRLGSTRQVPGTARGNADRTGHGQPPRATATHLGMSSIDPAWIALYRLQLRTRSCSLCHRQWRRARGSRDHRLTQHSTLCLSLFHPVCRRCRPQLSSHSPDPTPTWPGRLQLAGSGHPCRLDLQQNNHPPPMSPAHSSQY